LFCDGYEDRGVESAGVLAVEDVADEQTAVHLAGMAKRLSGRVTIYTNGDEGLSGKLEVATANEGDIGVDRRRIMMLEEAGSTESGGKVIVHLEDGAAVREGFMVHKPKNRVHGPFVGQLGIELMEKGFIKVSPPFNETTVKGVFATGDCASPFPAVVNAVAMGVVAAVGLAFQLQSEPKLAKED
jgi:thioredoxin reductase